MKISHRDSPSSPFQRLETAPQMPGIQPPELNLAADPLVRPGQTDPSPEQDGSMENREASEQQVLGKLSLALDGADGELMTPERMPLDASTLTGFTTKNFRFGGVNFELIDVGGDWQAESRRLLYGAIMLMGIYDQHDYQKQPATRKVRFYFGDFQAMAAYTKAHTELPYQEWSKKFTPTMFGGGLTATTWGLSFVSHYFDRRNQFTHDMQRNHHAFFVEASQMEENGTEKKFSDYKKALDLILTILHEATHTLSRNGGHKTDSGHLMHDGGPRHYLEYECTTFDPKTGKEIAFDEAKYRQKVLEVLEQFGKRFS